MNNWNSTSQSSNNWVAQGSDLQIDNWDPSTISSKKSSLASSDHSSYTSPPYRDVYSHNYDQKLSQSFASNHRNSTPQMKGYSNEYNSLSNYNPVTLPQKPVDGVSTGKHSPSSGFEYSSAQHHYNPSYYNQAAGGVSHYQSSYNQQERYTTEPKYEHRQKYVPNTIQPSKNLFSNPLNDPVIDDTRSEEERLVENLHKVSQVAQSSESRKPSGAKISKSALAMLSKDLCEAALPFQSPETLKAFRDMNLGFTPDNNSTVSPQSDLSSKNTNMAVPGDKRLSAKAKEFFPSTTVNKGVSEDDVTVLTNTLINKLIYDQSCYENSVPKFVESLHKFDLSTSSIEKLVEIIYEACISAPAFRYHGSQLCHILSQPASPVDNFRRILLKRAKSEFDLLDTTLQSKNDHDVVRARGLSLFMAELFDKLMIEDENGELKRLTVLGKAVINILEKLLSFPNDGNVMTAGKIIKLSIINLQDSLHSSSDHIQKLDSVLIDLCSNVSNESLIASTKRFIGGIITQRDGNWGRSSPEATNETSQQSSAIQMLEPIFYTDEGKPYTVLDTLESQLTSSDESDDPVLAGPTDSIPFYAESDDFNYYEEELNLGNKNDDDSLSDYDEEFERFLARKED